MGTLMDETCKDFAEAFAGKNLVPGGVGSVTTAVLAEHVVEAAERSAREEESGEKAY